MRPRFCENTKQSHSFGFLSTTLVISTLVGETPAASPLTRFESAAAIGVIQTVNRVSQRGRSFKGEASTNPRKPLLVLKSGWAS